MGQDTFGGERPPKGVLEAFAFKDLKHEALINGVTDFQISQDGKFLVYRANRKLRVLRAGEKPDEKSGSGTGPQIRVCGSETGEDLH